MDKFNLLLIIIILVILLIFIAIIWYINLNYSIFEKSEKITVEIEQLPKIDSLHNYVTFNPSAFVYQDIVYTVFRASYNRIIGFQIFKYYLNKKKHPSRIIIHGNNSYSEVITPLTEIENPWVYGYEDARSIIIKDKLYLIANAFLTDKLYCQLSILILDPKKLTQPQIIPEKIIHIKPSKNESQKNWMPFEYKEELYFVYSVNPHTILKPDLISGELQEIAKTFNKSLVPHNTTPFRGGTNIIKYKNKYLAVIHRAVLSTIGPAIFRYYLHQFYTFEPEFPFKVLEITEDFGMFKDSIYFLRDFDELKYMNTIFFAAGLVYTDNKLTIYYGENDNSASKFTISDSVLDQLLKPIT